MRFPSKITSYKESIISKFPIVLEQLRVKDNSVSNLYIEISKKITLKEYIDILDCLYILNEITLNKEVLHYAKRDTI